MTDTRNYYLEMLKTLREPPPTAGPLGFGRVELENTFVDAQRLCEDRWPDQVTYYCAPQVAASVIGTGQAWLCDVRSMNDESEFLFADQLFDAEIEAFRSERVFPGGLLDALEESKTGFVSTADGNAFNDRFIVAMCTSALDDDAAMWDRYGASGEGIGIHFSLRNLAATVSAAAIFVPNSNRFDTGIVEICYPQGGCDCLRRIAADSLAAFDQAQSPGELDMIRTLLHADVLGYLVRHKHPSFASEREFRVYSRAPARKNWAGSDHVYEDSAGSRIIRHTTIVLPHQAINESPEEFWRALIRGVTFGPECSEESRQGLDAALATRSLEGRAKSSACPLRRT